MYIEKSEKLKLSPLRRKVFFIILLILISLEIILFVFIKTEDTKEIDIDTTKYLQENLLTPNSTNIALKINLYLNDIYTPYFLIAFIYNFFTVYDSFILVNILSVDYIFSFLLKIIYYKSSYSSYDKENSNGIEIIYCGLGYAFPSEEIIIAVSLYLSIWKLSNKLSFKFTKKQKIIKYFFLALIIALLFYYCFCTLLQGYYFFSHIIFSIILGVIVYLVFLESNFFNLLKGKEFMDFIGKYNLLYIIINLSLFVIFSLIYIIMRVNIPENNDYEICSDNEGKEFNKSENYYSYLDGTFIFNVLLLSNVFSMVGINLDLKMIYKDNENSYYQNNFPQEFDELLYAKSKGSFAGSIHINQETVWNSTTLSVSLLRLIFILVFCWACFFPYIFVKLIEGHISLIFFIKMFLPPMLFFMGIFCYLKPFLKLMRLTNFTLQSISADI